MKLTDIAPVSSDVLNAKMQAKLGWNIKTENLKVNDAVAMLENVTNKLVLVRNSNKIHVSEKDANYTGMLMAQQVLESFISEKAKSPYAIGMTTAMKSTGDKNESVENNLDSIGDHKGLKAYAISLGPKHIDRHDLLTAASHMAFGNKDHLTKHLKTLDTDVRDKVKEYMKEEVDQIDEISSATLISYSQKAHDQIKGNQPAEPDKLRKRTNREQGIKLAFNKHYQVRTKVPATIKEKVDQIDEMHSIGSTAITYHDHIEAKEMTPAEIKAKHKSYLDTETHHRKRSKDPNLTSNQRMASGAVASAAKMAAAEWERKYMKEATEIDEANSHRKVDDLKSKGKHHEAGVLAAKSSHDRQYGAHFGMRSGKEEAQRQFFKGYDSVKKTNEEVEPLAEISAALAMRASRAATKEVSMGKSDREDKLIGLQKTADEKYRKMQGHSSSAKVATTENKRSVDDAIRRMINEDEVTQAQSVMAAKDMVDSLQDMLEDIGRMVNEQLPPLTDSIRSNIGDQQAQAFGAAATETLNGLLTQVQDAREAVNNAVLGLTGAAPAPVEAPSVDMGTDLDTEMPADEFGASDAAVGGELPLGREKRA